VIGVDERGDAASIAAAEKPYQQAIEMKLALLANQIQE
jgi:hypothetical protein